MKVKFEEETVSKIESIYDKIHLPDNQKNDISINFEDLVYNYIEPYIKALTKLEKKLWKTKVSEQFQHSDLSLSKETFVYKFAQVLLKMRKWGDFVTPIEDCEIFDTMTKDYLKFAQDDVLEFNIATIGESNLGKSSFIENILTHSSSRKGDREIVIKSNSSNVFIEKSVMFFKKNGVTVKLTVIETPGFESQYTKLILYKIVKYTEKCFKEYMDKEEAINRLHVIPDDMIHCCLFFIDPNGHKLKKSDLVMIKSLLKYMHVIPISPKSDSFTKDEMNHFQNRIRNDFEQHNVNFFPKTLHSFEHASFSLKNFEKTIPCKVITANFILDNRKVRKTLYCNIDVYNKNYSDMKLLEDVIFKDHTFTLKNSTKWLFYEKFRQNKKSAKFESHSSVDVMSNQGVSISSNSCYIPAEDIFGHTITSIGQREFNKEKVENMHNVTVKVSELSISKKGRKPGLFKSFRYKRESSKISKSIKKIEKLKHKSVEEEFFDLNDIKSKSVSDIRDTNE